MLSMALNAQRLEHTGDAAELRETRRSAMIEAAREVFFEYGYGGTSMSAIAAKIGGSKTTLWTYFPSKQVLFEAVVDDLVERYGSVIDDVPLPPGDAEPTLNRFGQAVVETVLSPPVLQLYRMVIGEAGRFPELGELYHQKGPGKAESRLTAFIESEMAAGRLRRAEPEMAALYFMQLCQAHHVQKALLCIAARVSKPQLAQDVQAAVGAFLKIYGAART